MHEKIRVRFAPSPTGHLHIGNLRTAIFNWLFARHHDGLFLVRIEDTDISRTRREYTESILATLEWAGLAPDETVIFQTGRFEVHKKLLSKLIDEGKAYRCYCTLEETQERCAAAVSGKKDLVHMHYDGFCRDKQHKYSSDIPHVIRFVLPKDVIDVSFDDLIRGRITINCDQLDDFIIARSDSTPVYNFVAVADDAYMKITHVIRGEDHISNTPKQILLYQALGYEIPYFAHLPLILSESGSRLSKRGDVAASVPEYRGRGYLADALINYLARLGWSHGDQEIFSQDELISFFTLQQVGKKGAIFDVEKLNWLNSIYIRNTLAKDLLDLIIGLRSRFRGELHDWSVEHICDFIELYKSRVQTLIELADNLKSLYDRSTPFNTRDVEKWVTPETTEQLREAVIALTNLDSFTQEAVINCMKKLCDTLQCKLVTIAQPIRIAVTGTCSGPGIFELLSLLGQAESRKRLLEFIRFIEERIQ